MGIFCYTWGWDTSVSDHKIKCFSPQRSTYEFNWNTSFKSVFIITPLEQEITTKGANKDIPKMNNRKTRTRCKICVVLCKMFYDVNDILVSLLLECFAPFSCVFIVHFEQVNFCWDNGSFNTLNAAGCSSNCQKTKKNYRVLNVYLKKVKCYLFYLPEGCTRSWGTWQIQWNWHDNFKNIANI